MAPKKADATATEDGAVTGFTLKETKMIAAAFVATIGADKYDFNLFASLTGNTAGSLKKMWPPVKRKVIEKHPTFLNSNAGASNEASVPDTKAPSAAKRKASAEPDEQSEEEAKAEAATASKKKPGPKGRKKKETSEGETETAKKPVAKRGRKKIKSEEEVNEEIEDDADE